MIKLLILALAIFGAISIIKKLTLGRKSATNTPPPETSARMQKCEHCKLHILEDQGLIRDDGFFCNQAHYLAHNKQN